MTELSAEAVNVSFLVNYFAEQVPGVRDAIVLSSDGLLMAMSNGITRESADRFAAAQGAVEIARGRTQQTADDFRDRRVVRARAAAVFQLHTLAALRGGTITAAAAIARIVAFAQDAAVDETTHVVVDAVGRATQLRGDVGDRDIAAERLDRVDDFLADGRDERGKRRVILYQSAVAVLMCHRLGCLVEICAYYSTHDT